jgi:hypothetical protein
MSAESRAVDAIDSRGEFLRFVSLSALDFSGQSLFHVAERNADY